MVPALANASRLDSTTSSIHLSAHLRSLSLHDLLEHLSFNPDLTINDRLPFFDNLCLESSSHDSDPDYSKIRTPYSADAFYAFLSKAQILHCYPELSFKLTHGFPLGNIVDLDTSFTPGNLASASPHDHIIQEYIFDELKLGRLSGPFTQKELEAKIGPFRSSPIQVVVKPGEAGGPDKYHCCRNLSYRGNLGFSVNDDINSEEYPTRWGTASECAKIVSFPSYLSFSLFLHISISFSYLSLVRKFFAAEFTTLSCLKDTDDLEQIFSHVFHLSVSHGLCEHVGLGGASRNTGMHP